MILPIMFIGTIKGFLFSVFHIFLIKIKTDKMSYLFDNYSNFWLLIYRYEGYLEKNVGPIIWKDLCLPKILPEAAAAAIFLQ